MFIMRNIKVKKELDKKSNLEKWLSNQELEMKKPTLSDKWIHDFENKLEWFLWDNDFDN